MKKEFHRYLVRKVGTLFEFSNGDIKILGSNRKQLTQLMDLWEAKKRKDLRSSIKRKASSAKRKKKSQCV